MNSVRGAAVLGRTQCDTCLLSNIIWIMRSCNNAGQWSHANFEHPRSSYNKVINHNPTIHPISLYLGFDLEIKRDGKNLSDGITNRERRFSEKRLGLYSPSGAD